MKRFRLTYVLVIVAVALVALFAVGQWGSRGTSGRASSEALQVAVPSPAAVNGAGQSASSAYDGAAATPANGAKSAPGSPTTLQTQEMVDIASLAVRVKDVDAAANALGDKARLDGGRVDGDNRTSDPAGRSATLVLRVPDTKLPGLITDATGYGEELSRTLHGEDMTAAHADVKARIAALQTSVNRLTDFLKRAGSIEQLVQAEDTLTQRQSELDSTVAQERALSDQVKLATLTVTLTAKPVLAALPVEHKGPLSFGAALAKGWHSVVTGARYSAAAAGYVLPYAAMVLVLGLLGWLAWTRRMSRPVVVLPPEII